MRAEYPRTSLVLANATLLKTIHWPKNSAVPHRFASPLYIKIDEEPAENIEHSRSEILDRTSSALESTRHILSARLASASTKSSDFIEEVVVQKEQLTQPLGKQKLQFSLKDGNPAGIALLGDRMEQFRKIVACTERELEALWLDRDKVQQEIKDLALEMLGPDAMVMLRDYLSIVERGQEDTEKAKAKEDVEAAKQKLMDEIEELSQGFIDKVEASEKVCYYCLHVLSAGKVDADMI